MVEGRCCPLGCSRMHGGRVTTPAPQSSNLSRMRARPRKHPPSCCRWPIVSASFTDMRSGFGERPWQPRCHGCCTAAGRRVGPSRAGGAALTQPGPGPWGLRRDMSDLEKIFEYFSTNRDEHGYKCMDPRDVVRALVPTYPPHNSTVERAGFLDGAWAWPLAAWPAPPAPPLLPPAPPGADGAGRSALHRITQPLGSSGAPCCNRRHPPPHPTQHPRPPNRRARDRHGSARRGALHLHAHRHQQRR